MRLSQDAQGFDLVCRIVSLFKFFQQHVRTVMQDNIGRRARVVIDGDIFEEGHEGYILEDLFVFLDVSVTLGGTLMIVEGDTG